MFGRSGEFRESIAKLRARIDAVISSVKKCVDVVDRINELSDRRNRAQGAQNSLAQLRPPQVTDSDEKRVEWIQQLKQLTHQLAASEQERRWFFGKLLDIPDTPAVQPHQLQSLCSKVETQRLEQIEDLPKQIRAWNEEIAILFNPFQSADAEVRGFIQEVRDVLDMVPVRPRQLRYIRREIERLPLWTNVRKAGPLVMQWTHGDLLKTRQRMDDLLAYLPEREGNDSEDQKATTKAEKLSPAAVIAGRCKARRESQRLLADKAGISPNTLKKIMDGKPVRSEKIAAVADALGCRYEDLLP